MTPSTSPTPNQAIHYTRDCIISVHSVPLMIRHHQYRVQIAEYQKGFVITLISGVSRFYYNSFEEAI